MDGGSNIRATLEFYHLPRFGGGKHVETRKFETGTTVADILQLFELGSNAGLTQLVNGRSVDTDHAMEDGDLLSVFYQPQGGHQAAQRL